MTGSFSPHSPSGGTPTEMSLGELGERGAELGRGGQARVVALPELTLPDVPGPLVFKEYKAGQAPVHGLSGIVALRSALPPAHRVVLDACTVWPVRVVHHGPSIAGVVMPLIPGEFLQERTLPSGRAERAPREVQNLFVDPDVAARVGMPLMSLERRLTVCRDLAAALAVLHDLGVVFGDINAKNVLFQRADAASVLLVDCDSVRVRGRGAVVRQLNSPDWDPPEGAVLSQATDMYKFGLFVLRTLSPSAQASVARDPARAAALLEDTGRALLDLALGTDPAERPSASHWANYLAERVAALRGRRSREDRANPSSTPRPPHSAASASGLPGQRGTAASQQRHPDPTQARPRGARATVFPLRPTAGPENRQEVPDTDAVWPTPAAPAAGRHSHHSRTAQDDADSAQHDPPDPAPSPQGRHARPHR